jgi:hypothetical protein
LAAHSRSRIILPRKPLSCFGVVFSLDRCLLMGDPRSPGDFLKLPIK